VPAAVPARPVRKQRWFILYVNIKREDLDLVLDLEFGGFVLGGELAM